MTKYLAAYAATIVVFAALDFLWLGLIAKSIYQQGIGHLMADRPNFIAATLFYAMFAVGLMVFAVAPGGSSTGWDKTLLTATLLGFFAYATYDLTNLATLKNWPINLTILDMVWGIVLSVVATSAGQVVWDRFA